jgi:hypothetical protein
MHCAYADLSSKPTAATAQHVVSLQLLVQHTLKQARQARVSTQPALGRQARVSTQPALGKAGQGEHSASIRHMALVSHVSGGPSTSSPHQGSIIPPESTAHQCKLLTSQESFLTQHFVKAIMPKLLQEPFNVRPCRTETETDTPKSWG